MLLNFQSKHSGALHYCQQTFCMYLLQRMAVSCRSDNVNVSHLLFLMSLFSCYTRLCDLHFTTQRCSIYTAPSFHSLSRCLALLLIQSLSRSFSEMANAWRQINACIRQLFVWFLYFLQHTTLQSTSPKRGYALLSIHRTFFLEQLNS